MTPLRPDPEAHAYARRNDPDTSREAAEKAVESGLVLKDRALLLQLLLANPGSTIPELARILSREGGGDMEACRQRLGRRTGDLVRFKLAHTRGKRDGCQIWWPGREPEDAKQGALFEKPAPQWRTD